MSVRRWATGVNECVCVCVLVCARVRVLVVVAEHAAAEIVLVDACVRVVVLFGFVSVSVRGLLTRVCSRHFAVMSHSSKTSGARPCDGTVQCNSEGHGLDNCGVADKGEVRQGR